MKLTKKTIVLIGMLLAAAAVFIIYREYNRKPANVATLTPLFSLEANQLVAEFVTNEDAANKKFLGKPIEITGTSIAGGNASTILLKTNTAIKVSCSMDSTEYSKRKPVSEGQPLKVRGFCTGLLMDVELNRCVIIE